MTEDLFSAFSDQVLAFDSATSTRHYAEIVTRRERAGRPIDALDAQIAAICRNGYVLLATLERQGLRRHRNRRPRPVARGLSALRATHPPVVP